MRLTKITILTILLCSLNSINITAQNQKPNNTVEKQYLKGLTKATKEVLKTQRIEMDGESFSVYNFEGKRIKGYDLMEAFISGNYFPDFYMDLNNEIKAAVLREATEDEKAQMKVMKDSMDGESELIGQDGFSFSATDINGKEYSLDELKGRIIVMNFWFIQCKPCIMEMPELNELVKKYRTNKDVVFLGFAINEKEELNSFLKKKSFLYKLIPDSQKIADDYKVSSYPTHIIIDKNSKIAYLSSGLSPTTTSSIENSIEKLIEE